MIDFSDRSLAIGLDFDGVLADCSALKAEVARTLYQVDLPLAFMKEYLAVGQGLLTREQYRAMMGLVCGDPTVGMRMEAVKGAVNATQRLRAAGHALRIITSREATEENIARQWCVASKIDIPIISVGYGGDKRDAAQGLDVYIDDDLPKLLSLIDMVPKLFLFSWEYNQTVVVPESIERIHSWEEFFERFDHYEYRSPQRSAF